MSKNTIRAAAGPWGSVRCEIRPGATYSVACWVNNKAQVPAVGLDAAEAFELADELLAQHTNLLMIEHGRKLCIDDVTEIAKVYGIADIVRINEVWVECNRLAHFEAKQRREVCHREFHYAQVEMDTAHKGMDDMMEYATGGFVQQRDEYLMGELNRSYTLPPGLQPNLQQVPKGSHSVTVTSSIKLPHEMTKQEAQDRLAKLRASLARSVTSGE